MQPLYPHPMAQAKVTIEVTQEQLAILHMGVDRVADQEDGEFAYIREVAENLTLPGSIVAYGNLRV